MAGRIRKFISVLTAVAIVLVGAVGYFYVVKNYPKVFASSLTMENENPIYQNDSIVLNFSDSIAKNSLQGAINIEPKVDANFVWLDRNKRLIITPAEGWELSRSYKIVLENGKNIFGGAILNNTISFETEKFPELISFYPADGSKDIVVDIEDPILLKFNKSIEDYDFSFVTSPAVELSYEKIRKDNSLKVMPKTSFDKGTEYAITVSMINQLNGQRMKVAESSFSTREPAPATWDKDFSSRLAQAKKFTQPRIREGKYIDINVKSQIMATFENGKILDAFLISSGKRGMDTPIMETKIYNKYPRAWSKTYQLFMPFWMAIRGDGKYGIHELPEWPGGFKEGANHLGTPVSHGCVRLGVGAADAVYNFAEIGTPVIIHD